MKKIIRRVIPVLLIVGCSALAACSPRDVVRPVAALTTAHETTTTTSSETTPSLAQPIAPGRSFSERAHPKTTTTTTPQPPPVAAPDPGPQTDSRLAAAYIEAVPARWRNGLPVSGLTIIPGTRSQCCPNGEIQISEGHMASAHSLLVFTIAHEFGHHIESFYVGAMFSHEVPEWPGTFDREQWADCVATAFTGMTGYGTCNDQTKRDIAAGFVNDPPARMGI